MSSHPNVILMAELVPDDLTRKTYRGILADHADDDEDYVKVGSDEYHMEVMESNYLESMQISAKEGSIVVFAMITYGYGERVSFSDIEDKRDALATWCREVCGKHNCNFNIYITANYW